MGSNVGKLWINTSMFSKMLLLTRNKLMIKGIRCLALKLDRVIMPCLASAVLCYDNCTLDSSYLVATKPYVVQLQNIERIGKLPGTWISYAE